MSNDLSYSLAAIDWVEGNIPEFESRIQKWIECNLTYAFEVDPSSTRHDFVVIIERQPFPLSFSVEAGSYINTLRSSLDILLTNLAERYNLTGIRDAKGRIVKAYFPYSENEAAFKAGSYKGKEIIAALPLAERRKIEDFRPYDGGNDTFSMLNKLDNTRKHRRLLYVGIKPWSVGVAFFGKDIDPQEHVRRFEMLWPYIRDGNTLKVGRAAKGNFGRNLTVNPLVVIDDETTEGAWPICERLRAFVRMCRDIITKFE